MDAALYIANIFVTLFIIYAVSSLPFAIVQLIAENIFLNKASHFSKGIRLLVEGDSKVNSIFTRMVESPMISQANILSNNQDLHFFEFIRNSARKSPKSRAIKNPDIKPDRLASSLIYGLGLGKARERINHQKLDRHAKKLEQELTEIVNAMNLSDSAMSHWKEKSSKTNRLSQAFIRGILESNTDFSESNSVINADYRELLYFLMALKPNSDNKETDNLISYQISKVERMTEVKIPEVTLREVVSNAVSLAQISPLLRQTLDYVTKVQLDSEEDFEPNFNLMKKSLSSWFEKGIELEQKIYQRKKRIFAFILGFFFCSSTKYRHYVYHFRFPKKCSIALFSNRPCYGIIHR